MSRRERVVVAALALLMLALRAAAFFRYRFDSDEPQHLHVAWGWTAGLVQYRDLFDNHAPLFHILSAPLLRAVGERSDALFFMRAPMLLLFAVVLWATYLLGKRLYSARVGVWAALLLSLFPPFFLKSLEYRTDNLWNTLWMVVLVVLTSRLPGRLWVTGLLLGVAFCVSLKTSLLLITLGTAGLVTYFFALKTRTLRPNVMSLLAPILLCAAVAPALTVWWFRAHGAWPQFVYCVFRFNELLVLTRSTLSIWAPRLIYLPAMALMLRRAWKRRAGREEDPVALWRYFFAIGSAAFVITLVSFWILISPRDLLPVMPLASIFFVAWIEPRPLRVPALACFACVPFILVYSNGLRNGTREYTTMIDQVLHLSQPGEPLMDYKGETVFRRRPYYYIFEFITRNEMQAGLIPDTIERDVIRARCHVAQADGDFWPARGRAFLIANFLDMGRLRASGQMVRDDGLFTIAVPGEYVVITTKGMARGLVDGKPNVPRFFDQGLYRYTRTSPDEHPAVLWAPAFARGFSPFHLRDREF
jgi:hypothetical protein